MMGLESLTFDFDGTKVELKCELKAPQQGGFIYLAEAVVTPPGRTPTKTFLRYDIDKRIFIDTLLPHPTPYDDFDREAFDVSTSAGKRFMGRAFWALLYNDFDDEIIKLKL